MPQIQSNIYTFSIKIKPHLYPFVPETFIITGGSDIETHSIDDNDIKPGMFVAYSRGRLTRFQINEPAFPIGVVLSKDDMIITIARSGIVNYNCAIFQVGRDILLNNRSFPYAASIFDMYPYSVGRSLSVSTILLNI